MKTDRELLELAAKAAGHPIIRWETDEDGIELAVIDSGYWQPLHMNTTTDCMGDALRLAVKLNIGLEFVQGLLVIAGFRRNHEDRRDHNDDLTAATRRAIVRAAAAIGENL